MGPLSHLFVTVESFIFFCQVQIIYI